MCHTFLEQSNERWFIVSTLKPILHSPRWSTGTNNVRKQDIWANAHETRERL